jgi:hypothetical protein
VKRSRCHDDPNHQFIVFDMNGTVIDFKNFVMVFTIFVSCFDFLKRTRGRERMKAGGAKPAEIKDEDELEDNQNDTSCQDKSEQD